MNINTPLQVEAFEVISVKFSNNKCPRMDGLDKKMNMRILTLLSTTMLAIFNRCLEEIVFLSVWKESYIVLITKSGTESVHDPFKYKPISSISMKTSR